VTANFHGFPVVEGHTLLIVREGRDPWVAVPYGRVLKAALPNYEKDRDAAATRLAGLKKKNEEVQSPAYEQQMRDHLEKYSGAFKTTNPQKWQGRVEGMQRELKYNREKAAREANPQRDAEGSWYWEPVDAHAAAARRLAEMKPGEAARPACYVPLENARTRYAMPGDVLPVGANPRCQEVVTNNYAYFDPSLPRGAPQILLVGIGRCVVFANGQWRGPSGHNRLSPPQGCFRHAPIWEQMDWTKVASLLAR
jgi:hypothetical protein